MDLGLCSSARDAYEDQSGNCPREQCGDRNNVRVKVNRRGSRGLLLGYPKQPASLWHLAISTAQGPSGGNVKAELKWYVHTSLFPIRTVPYPTYPFAANALKNNGIRKIVDCIILLVIS